VAEQLQHLHSLAITSSSKRYGSGHAPYARLQCANSKDPNRSKSSRGRASSGDGSSDDSCIYSDEELEGYMYQVRQRGKHTTPTKVNPFQHVASTLTSLKLHSVDLDGFHGGLGSLTALTALQHLDLQLEPDQQHHYNCYQEFHGLLQLSNAPELGDVLGQLTGTTHLCLQWQMDDKLKEALGGLFHLRELHLHPLGNDSYHREHTSPVTPLRLPLALTCLEVHLRMDIDSSSIPDLPSLAGLQHLQLVNCNTLEASLMAGLAQLTYLHIEPDWLNTFNDTPLAALMSVLPQLQHLRYLQLGRSPGRDDCDPKLSIPLDLCSAVTSASSLVSLHLGGVQLPPSCGTRLFGQMLPHLKTINICALSWYKINEATSQKAIGPHGDLDSLVKNCPNLSELNLAGAVQFGVDLSSLQHLKHLTRLCF
jgi:hypothetical protein